MKVVLFGIQKVDFANNEGAVIKGLKLHMFREPESKEVPNWNGMVYEKQWVAAESTCQLFGVPARQFFDNFKNNMSVKYPIDCIANYDVVGRRIEFNSLVKSDK